MLNKNLKISSMRKHFVLLLTLSTLFLQGCDKTDDLIVGKGTIHYDGYVY